MKLLKVLLIFTNVCICFSFGLFVLMFNQFGKPFTRGFYCNAESISKPFKESSISASIVVIIACFLGLLIFILTDVSKFVLMDSFIVSVPFCFRLKRVKNAILRNVVIVSLIYMLGMGITMFITDIGKYSVGRLRPHFLDVCKPDWATLNCTNKDGTPTYFVGNEFCANNQKDTWRFKNARLSFPSGHSSYSGLYIFYSPVYYFSCLFHNKKCINPLTADIFTVCGLVRSESYTREPRGFWVLRV